MTDGRLKTVPKGETIVAKRTIFERFLAVFYPERCCCCGRTIACGSLVCGGCRKKLDVIRPPVCPLCGRGTGECRCRRRRRQVERCVSPFYYTGAARSALLRLKFSKKTAAAELFCQAMAHTVRREYAGIAFDCLVPVPISRATLRQRGYNQSAVLAGGLGKRIGLPVRPLLIKMRQTEPQRTLPAYRRSGNVLGVFDVKGEAGLAGMTVLLVDDVATTGATLDECAKMLKIYGAKAVYAVTATASRLSKEEE